MAKLENEFKQTVGIEGKIKMTVAEMILSITQSATIEDLEFGISDFNKDNILS
jgi:hypothetical protein